MIYYTIGKKVVKLFQKPDLESKKMKLFQTIMLLTSIVSFLVLHSGCQEIPKNTSVNTQQSEHPPIIESQKSVKKPTKAKPQKGKPVLKVENPVHNFGVMGPNQKKSGEFKFKNVGDGILKINKVKSTCGCTVPQLKKKKYAPGESGVIQVSFRSSSRQKPVTKHLYIESNDSKKPKFELTIKAQVKVNIAANPKKLNLSIVEENAGAKPITITSKDSKTFAIKSFVSTKDIITTEFDPTVESTKFILEPKVDIEKLKKTLKGNVKINVTHPSSSVVTIPFSTKPPFELSRTRLIIQNALPGKYETKNIWVMSNYDTKVEIESITSTKKYMEIIGRELKDKNVKLTIKITPPQKTDKVRSFTDSLKIKLKSGDELTIRCSGFYKREPKKKK